LWILLSIELWLRLRRAAIPEWALMPAPGEDLSAFAALRHRSGINSY